MAGLPKIALARLKAKPGALKSSGSPEGNAGLPGARHPDANLLAAFVEKTLNERERTRVLHHLATCAECREVAAFTLPAEVAAAEPARVAAGQRWSPWLVLRWGAMAAVLGALAIVVVLHPGMWKGPQEISIKTPLPAPAGNITSTPQTVSQPPLSPPPPEPARARAQSEARESAGELAATQPASAPHQDLALNNHVVGAAKQQVTVMASTQPPATLKKVESVPAVKAEEEESKEGNALTAAAHLPPAAPSAPATVTTGASEAMAKASAGSQAGPAAFRSTTQSVEVRSSGGFGGRVAGGGGGGGVSAPAEKVAPQTPAATTVRMTAQAPMVAMRASRKDVESEASLPAALWSVASDGRVQRSMDGGKTYEQIPIAHGIKFRAVAALGNDVWAGGRGGALFHSLDGGATWTWTGINFEGSAVTETITGIQLHDPQHLTVATASGSPWVSEDGGQHWRKQP